MAGNQGNGKESERLTMTHEDNPPNPRRVKPAFKIRPFGISDLPTIMEIERKAFPDAWDESWFIYFYQTTPDGFFVAVDDSSQVIGYSIVEVDGSGAWHHTSKGGRPRQRGHLVNIAVDEHHRERGVGTALLEAVAKYSVSRGANELFLEVKTTNSTARRFYLNNGFKETRKTLRDYYPGGGDALVMRKKLS